VCLAQAAFYYAKPFSQFVLDKQTDEQKTIPPQGICCFKLWRYTARPTHIQTIVQQAIIAWQQKKTWISASILNRMTSPGFPVSVKI